MKFLPLVGMTNGNWSKLANDADFIRLVEIETLKRLGGRTNGLFLGTVETKLVYMTTKTQPNR